MVDMTQRETVDAACQGCGVEASVVFEDVPLCGTCFYIASLTALRRARRLAENRDADRATNIVELLRHRR